MQYVARSQLKVQGLDGVLRTVQPGDALPEFTSWEYCLRQAHLDNGTVEEIGGQHTANLNFDGGYISMGPKEPVEPNALDVLDEVAVVAEPGLSEPASEAKGFPCTFCDKVFFRPSRLKAHIAKRH